MININNKINIKSIKQIEYNDWGAKLEPEHENYWAHINYISHMIASLLEDWRTEVKQDPFNPDKMIYYPTKYNTIIVSDYKEKFGQARVYCYFADPMLVEQHYIEKNIKKITLEQYREQCLKQDMLHYRNVYFILKQCFPQYWNAISKAADFSELLYETKEEYLEDMEKEIQGCKPEWRPTSLEKSKNSIFQLLKWK